MCKDSPNDESDSKDSDAKNFEDDFFFRKEYFEEDHPYARDDTERKQVTEGFKEFSKDGFLIDDSLRESKIVKRSDDQGDDEEECCDKCRDNGCVHPLQFG